MPWQQVLCNFPCTYFRGLQSEQEVLLTHGDSIDRVASNLKVIAKSGDLVAGIIN